MKDIKQEKKRIRHEIKSNFKNLNPADFDSRSKKVLENLVKLPQWKTSDTILIFLSLPDEIKTDLIIQKALKENKKTAVPRIQNNDLLFHLIETLDADFITHQLGVDEPDETFPEVNHFNLIPEKTMILVPGLAYDKNCFRLGRGKGFYDRFLSSINTSIPKIGIGYDFQILESVPVEDHDIPLDMIITESTIIAAGKI